MARSATALRARARRARNFGIVLRASQFSACQALLGDLIVVDGTPHICLARQYQGR